MKATEVLNDLRRRFPNEPEYLQAVEEVITTIEDAYNKHPEFDRYNLIERLCIPDRIFSFRVSWIDDKGRRIMADIHAQASVTDASQTASSTTSRAQTRPAS